MPERVSVRIHSTDALSEAGMFQTLRYRPELSLQATGDPSADPAEVVALAVAEHFDADVAEWIRTLHDFGRRRIVLVVPRIDDKQLLIAVEAGVCGLVPRAEASPERLVSVLRAAATGQGSLPPDVLGLLLNQVSRLQRNVLTPRGIGHTGLTTRETNVLRLMADGLPTHEIARELAYSERTVKNVLHDLLNRLQLRNRCHAVAYAVREGLI